jgi:hypothetical protein
MNLEMTVFEPSLLQLASVIETLRNGTHHLELKVRLGQVVMHSTPFGFSFLLNAFAKNLLEIF